MKKNDDIPNNKKGDGPPAKAFLIGAGFDQIFGLPSWKELIIFFEAYLISNSIRNKVQLKKKIDFIKKRSESPIRKMQLLLTASEEHFDEESEKIKNDFLKKNLDIRHYESGKDKRIIFKSFSDSNSIIMTTNVSNTLSFFNLKPTFQANEAYKIGRYVPIHGNAFEEKNNKNISETVLLENDYISKEYKERLDQISSILVLNKIEELHIFGYSLNDSKLLNEFGSSKIKKVVIYHEHQDDIYQKMMSNYFKKLIERCNKKAEIITGDSKKNKQKDKFSVLFNKFKKSIDDTRLLNIDNIQKIFEYNNEKEDYEIISQIKNINFNKIHPLFTRFLEELKKRKNAKAEILKIIKSIKKQIKENIIKKKHNHRMLLILEILSYNIHFPKEIKGSNLYPLINEILDNKYYSHGTVKIYFRGLVKNISKDQLSIKYFVQSGDYEFLMHTRVPSSRKEWIDLLIKFFKNKDFVKKIMEATLKLKEITRDFIPDYGKEMNSVRTKIFKTILATIKKNSHFFQEEEYKEWDKWDITNYNKLYFEIFPRDLALIWTLFKKNVNKKIKIEDAIKDKFLISWFADQESKMKLYIEKTGKNKLKKEIADLFYIESDSNLREKIEKINNSNTNHDWELEYIEKKYNLKDKDKSEILNDIFKEDIKKDDVDDVAKYLLEKKETKIEWFLQKIKESKNIKNKFKIEEIVSQMINDKNKHKILEFLRKNKFNFTSYFMMNKIEEDIKEEDIKLIFKSFLNNLKNITFLKKYSRSDLFSSFEGIILTKIMQNSDKEFILESCDKMLNIGTEGFQGAINAILFINDQNTDISENEDFIFSFISTLSLMKMPREKITNEVFVNYFEKYLEIISQEKLKNEKYYLNYLIPILRDCTWDKIERIMHIIDNNEFFNETWDIIFDKGFNFKKTPAYENLIKTKFYKKSLENFSLREIRFYEKDSEKYYEIEPMIEFIKNGKYKIQTYDFFRFIKFCRINNFNNDDIVKVINKITKPKEGEFINTINFPDKAKNELNWLKEKLERKYLVNFVKILEKKDVEIPPELIEYFYENN